MSDGAPAADGARSLTPICSPTNESYDLKTPGHEKEVRGKRASARRPWATGRRGRWTAAAVPALEGRVAVITGANSGVGLETTSILAARGATVVLACRDGDKARSAADQIMARTGADPVKVRVVQLDLASLNSVREAADQIKSAFARVDLLINNAAVMRPPYQRSADGLELTFATNHLGHFALTGRLLDRLLAAPGSRIVTVSSVGHRDGTMRWEDLQFEDGYVADDAYAQSKLANLLFTYELQARLQESGSRTIATAAHPGLARTSLWRWDPLHIRILASPVMGPLTFWLAQSPRKGAWPTLRAATDPAARGGEYYGPGGRNEYTGRPVVVSSSAASHDVAARRRLWRESERLSGVRYNLDRRPGRVGSGR
jgi:NAD(P)-dependent dehydrogenase (short-subunit alcohol dehydrogenase family)